uniref:Uncharacterized protein n=1 Tax=Arion vulgaris TaxID=1028688 RepID=A0A0B6Y3L9_9EUPU
MNFQKRGVEQCAASVLAQSNQTSRLKETLLQDKIPSRGPVSDFRAGKLG